jgi:hypothetical protein
MIWAWKNFLSDRIRFACPVMDLFHPYKKLLEDVWRRPELYYTFFAPLEHAIHADSKVRRKPKLKQIESFFLALRHSWGEFRDRFLALQNSVQGDALCHLRNIILLGEFFLPLVLLISLCSFMFSRFNCFFLQSADSVSVYV